MSDSHPHNLICVAFELPKYRNIFDNKFYTTKNTKPFSVLEPFDIYQKLSFRLDSYIVISKNIRPSSTLLQLQFSIRPLEQGVH